MENLQEVESFGADLRIVHESNKKMGTYTEPRDFVYAEYRDEMDNVLEVFQTSVEHYLIPEVKGFVRGRLYYRIFRCEKEGAMCKFSMEGCIHPKGPVHV